MCHCSSFVFQPPRQSCQTYFIVPTNVFVGLQVPLGHSFFIFVQGFFLSLLLALRPDNSWHGPLPLRETATSRENAHCEKIARLGVFRACGLQQDSRRAPLSFQVSPEFPRDSPEIPRDSPRFRDSPRIPPRFPRDSSEILRDSLRFPEILRYL